MANGGDGALYVVRWLDVSGVWYFAESAFLTRGWCLSHAQIWNPVDLELGETQSRSLNTVTRILQLIYCF